MSEQMFSPTELFMCGIVCCQILSVFTSLSLLAFKHSIIELLNLVSF